MKTFIRAVSVILTLIVVLVVALGVFISTLDPNDYRQRIVDLAAEQGVELQIQGDLGWKFFPQLGMNIGQSQVHKTDPSTKLDASLNEFQVYVQLLPLLGKRVEIRGITVDGANISIEQLAQSVASASDSASASQGASGGELDLSIDQLSITNSTFTYAAIDAEPLAITNFNFVAENFNLANEPFSADLNLMLSQGGEPLIAEPLRVTLSGQMTANSADLQLESLSTQLAVADNSLPINLSAGLAWNGAASSVSLDGLALAVGEVTLNAELEATLAPLNFTADVRLDEFSPKQMLALLGSEMVTTDPDVLSALAGSLRVAGSDTAIELSPLQLTLDDSSLQGSASLALGDTPQIVANFQLDEIDVDRYMPPATEEEAASAGAPLDTTARILPELPAHSAELTFQVNQLVLSKIPMTDARLKLTTSENAIQLSELRASAGDGSLLATANMGLSDAPSHQFSMNLSSVRIDSLLANQMDEPPLTGVVNATLSGTSSGDSIQAIRSGLVASGKLTAEEMTVLGLDLESAICDISDRIERKSLTSNYDGWGDSTQLDDIIANINVENDQASVTGIRAAIGNIGASGEANADLAAQSFVLNLAALISSATSSEGGCPVSEYLRDVEIPLQCSGTFGVNADASCGPQDGYLQTLVTKALTSEAGSELVDKLLGDDEDSSAIKDALSNFF